jgi:hypothetical protein
LILEMQLHTEETLKWYRRAAAATHRLEEREKKTEQARRNNAGTR